MNTLMKHLFGAGTLLALLISSFATHTVSALDPAEVLAMPIADLHEPILTALEKRATIALNQAEYHTEDIYSSFTHYYNEADAIMAAGAESGMTLEEMVPKLRPALQGFFQIIRSLENPEEMNLPTLPTLDTKFVRDMEKDIVKMQKKLITEGRKFYESAILSLETTGYLSASVMGPSFEVGGRIDNFVSKYNAPQLSQEVSFLASFNYYERGETFGEIIVPDERRNGQIFLDAFLDGNNDVYVAFDNFVLEGEGDEWVMQEIEEIKTEVMNFLQSLDGKHLYIPGELASRFDSLNQKQIKEVGRLLMSKPLLTPVEDNNGVYLLGVHTGTLSEIFDIFNEEVTTEELEEANREFQDISIYGTYEIGDFGISYFIDESDAVGGFHLTLIDGDVHFGAEVNGIDWAEGNLFFLDWLIGGAMTLEFRAVDEIEMYMNLDEDGVFTGTIDTWDDAYRMSGTLTKKEATLTITSESESIYADLSAIQNNNTLELDGEIQTNFWEPITINLDGELTTIQKTINISAPTEFINIEEVEGFSPYMLGL